MNSPIILPSLPSTYFATDIEIALLTRCLNSNRLLNKSFQISELATIASELAISKKDQIYVFQGLIRHGILYSLSENVSTSYISLKVNYYLSAEKIIQAFITHNSELVIGRQLFKFDIDGKLFDGGFISSQQQVFSNALEKLQTKFFEYGKQTTYLPSFIRIYECIGFADGRDFFSKSQLIYHGGDSITQRAKKKVFTEEKLFVIPKYVVLNNHNGALTRDTNKMCVCIS